MPACWTCGTSTNLPTHTCPACQAVTALEEVNITIAEGSLIETQLGLAQLAMQREMVRGIDRLADANKRGFRQVCDVLRWSTTELAWRLDQQQEALVGIDETLRTPSETQANEFRQMAEKLVARGVLEDAREFYEKALNLNRLDYRIYVGLAGVLVKQNEIANSLSVLERSLPHAPKSPFSLIADYKSYSLRLMARGQLCLGKMSDARRSIDEAIALSPFYYEARFDLAKIACEAGDEGTFEDSLNRSIVGSPAYWHFAYRDPTLLKCRTVLERVLRAAFKNARDCAEQRLNELTIMLQRLDSRFRDVEYMVVAALNNRTYSLVFGRTRIRKLSSKLEKARATIGKILLNRRSIEAKAKENFQKFSAGSQYQGLIETIQLLEVTPSRLFKLESTHEGVCNALMRDVKSMQSNVNRQLVIALVIAIVCVTVGIVLLLSSCSIEQ